MAKSLIELKSYFFPIVDIKANPKHNPEDEIDITLDIDSAVLKPDERYNYYQLLTDIKVSEEDSKNEPYLYHVQTVGFFSLNDDLPKNELKELLHNRGIESLNSATRELILMITGRGPWGAIGLPIHDPSEIELREIDINQEPNLEG
ncbi:hypothetical protein [uncultured Desulfuromusa sp.]|uniref:hypothetical protein n=1 Tax=uncultured Desulfuromusa sp. TaxID=219183 RepID=UPI002AA71C49|nr:hypothetical protein [uncultured Desulfuromusa sp.]